jgi:hypothetical protein
MRSRPLSSAVSPMVCCAVDGVRIWRIAIWPNVRTRAVLPFGRQCLPDRTRRPLAHRMIQASARPRIALGCQVWAIRRIAGFLTELRKNTEQLDPLGKWYRILGEALRHFLHGRQLQPQLRLNPALTRTLSCEALYRTGRVFVQPPVLASRKSWSVAGCLARSVGDEMRGWSGFFR